MEYNSKKSVEIFFMCYRNIYDTLDGRCVTSKTFIGKGVTKDEAYKKAIAKANRAGWRGFDGRCDYTYCPTCVKEIIESGSGSSLVRLS